MIRPTWQITNWLSLRAQLSTDITDTKQTLEYETERPNSCTIPAAASRTSTDAMTSCTAM